MKMKKILAIMMSLMLALSMTACGGEDVAEETEEVVESVEAEEEVEEEVVEEEATEEPAEEVEEVVEEVIEEEETEETVEEEYATSLFDLPMAETPNLPGTTWSIAGAMFDGVELEADQLENEVLPLYGGQLDFAFYEDRAELVQGNGTLEGTCQYMEEGAMVTIEHEGETLKYACVFADIDGLTVMIALTDDTGYNGIYFVQN